MINKSNFESDEQEEVSSIIDKENHLRSDKDYSEVLEVSDLQRGFTIKLGSARVSVEELCNLLLILKDDLFNNDYKREPSYTG